MKDILDKCTAYDPNDRFQDVDELKDALLFVMRKEFHAPLIVLMIVIVLLATSQTLNSGEDLQAVQSTVEELR